MMMNLFSSFDPCTGLLSLNWMSSMIMMMMPLNYWMVMSTMNITYKKMMNYLILEMKSITKNKGMMIMTTSLFMFILINNMMGLIPYIFTSSSHMIFSLSISLSLWMSMMIYGWINKTNYMLSHLVPIGTPSMLMPFMVVIESISNIIRPGSLAVRLTANMIAGHLLMSLLGNNLSGMTITMTIMLWTFMALMMFEMAVAIIQSYVFMTLTTLYSSEV